MSNASSAVAIRRWKNRIVILTGLLVATGAMIEAIIVITNKTESLSCAFARSWSWCSRQDVSVPPAPIGPFPPIENPATRVTAFVIMAYNKAGDPAGGMSSARREWRRVTPDRWVENYPGGIPSYFDVIGRMTLSDCPGTIVRNELDSKHRVFIPDKGCAGMPFYISDDNRNWGIAAAMAEVQ